MKIQASSICKIINDINSKELIKTIIFVGGYCSNEILLKLIKNDLIKITTYLQPSNPSLSIMEGAVLFGIQPSSINVRKAKYTIRELIMRPWDDKLHSGKGKKIYLEEFEKYFCENCFSKYIEVNQNLKYEEEIFKESYAQTNIALSIFYKTKKVNPTFISEEGMIKIGECRIIIDKKYKNYENRRIKTIMKFGGTFIDVTGIHLKSGKSVKTTLNFD